MRYPRSILSRKLLEAFRQPGLQCKIPKLSRDSKRHQLNLRSFADIWSFQLLQGHQKKLTARSEARLSSTKSESATHLSPGRSETCFSPTSQVRKTATRWSPARSEIVTSQVGNCHRKTATRLSPARSEVVTSQVGNCHKPGRKPTIQVGNQPSRSETRFSPPVRSFRS